MAAVESEPRPSPTAMPKSQSNDLIPINSALPFTRAPNSASPLEREI